MIYVDSILAFILGCGFPLATTKMELVISGLVAAAILLLLQKIRHIGAVAVLGQGVFMSIKVSTTFIAPYVDHFGFIWAGGILLFIAYYFLNAKVIEDNKYFWKPSIKYYISKITRNVTSVFRRRIMRLKYKVKSVKKGNAQNSKAHGNKSASGNVQHDNNSESTQQFYRKMERERERIKQERERFERERKAQQSQRSRSNASFFSGCKNKSEVEARYKYNAKKFHPDNGGSAEDFIRMTNEYNRIKNAL